MWPLKAHAQRSAQARRAREGSLPGLQWVSRINSSSGCLAIDCQDGGKRAAGHAEPVSETTT